MTLPYERKNAVTQTEKFLLELCNPKLTPKIPSQIRARARSLLRHYPSNYDMDRASELSFEIFSNKL